MEEGAAGDAGVRAEARVFGPVATFFYDERRNSFLMNDGNSFHERRNFFGERRWPHVWPGALEGSPVGGGRGARRRLSLLVVPPACC